MLCGFAATRDVLVYYRGVERCPRVVDDEYRDEMPIDLPVNDGDDLAFVQCVERLLARDISDTHPLRVYVARMDNWFGDRWYSFRGKAFGRFGVHNRPGYKKHFVVPPFVPERVLSETCYERMDDGSYTQGDSPRRLAISQKGEENFHRWLDRFDKSGLLIWYSGNTAKQDRASVMLYVHTPDVTDAWYLSVCREQDAWRYQKGIEITKREFEETE
jgi:hypothetical protein